MNINDIPSKNSISDDDISTTSLSFYDVPTAESSMAIYDYNNFREASRSNVTHKNYMITSSYFKFNSSTYTNMRICPSNMDDVL